MQQTETMLLLAKSTEFTNIWNKQMGVKMGGWVDADDAPDVRLNAILAD